MKKARKILSGGKNELTAQMASEIKKLPAKMKAAIGRAGFKSPVINKETHAKIKSDLGLSWNQKRKLRWYLKTAGIEQEGEQS